MQRDQGDGTDEEDRTKEILTADSNRTRGEQCDIIHENTLTEQDKAAI